MYPDNVLWNMLIGRVHLNERDGSSKGERQEEHGKNKVEPPKRKESTLDRLSPDLTPDPIPSQKWKENESAPRRADSDSSSRSSSKSEDESSFSAVSGRVAAAVQTFFTQPQSLTKPFGRITLLFDESSSYKEHKAIDFNTYFHAEGTRNVPSMGKLRLPDMKERSGGVIIYGRDKVNWQYTPSLGFGAYVQDNLVGHVGRFGHIKSKDDSSIVLMGGAAKHGVHTGDDKIIWGDTTGPHLHWRPTSNLSLSKKRTRSIILGEDELFDLVRTIRTSDDIPKYMNTGMLITDSGLENFLQKAEQVDIDIISALINGITYQAQRATSQIAWTKEHIRAIKDKKFEELPLVTSGFTNVINGESYA